MSSLILNKYQLRTLLDMTGLVPAPWSPLVALPEVPRGCAPGEPDFVDLVEKGLVAEEAAYSWRPNRMGAAVLAAACTPEELIGVKPSHSRIPGFTIVRRGELVAECTVEARTGDAKLVFPISRNAVVLRFIESLTDRDDEPTPELSLDLDRNESFLLSVLARVAATEVPPITLDRLYASARADLDDDQGMSALAAGGILPDLTAASDLGPAFAGLERAGVVVRTGQTIALTPAAEVLVEPARAAFTITKVETGDGTPRRDGVFVSRHADRTLVLRTTTDDPPRVRWMEVMRPQLRALIAAFLLPSDVLAEWVAQREGAPGPAAAGPPSGPAPAPTVAPASRVSIPPEGLAAFGSPGLDQPPVATLAGGIVLTLVERQGSMARVRADNGWEGWVVEEHLVTTPATPPPPPVAPTRVRVPDQGLPAFDTVAHDTPPIATLAGGIVLTVVEQQGSMARVRADNGWEGWVSSRLLQPV